MTTTPEFDTKLAAFVEGCKKIHADYCARMNYKPVKDEWRVDHGDKRCRVVHNDSAFCFVDYATGDVFKCDGWKRPAKHARGNINDEHGGLKSIGPHGPAYLK